MSSSCTASPVAVNLISHEHGLSFQDLNNQVGIRGELQDTNVKPSSSNNEGSSNSGEEDHMLKSAKAEMGEVREENERLKMMLQQVEKDYNSLKLRFFEILQQESCQNPADSAPTKDDSTEEPELVSLSLGRNTETTRKDDKAGSSSKSTKEYEELKDSLSLGLESKFQIPSELVLNSSPTNSPEQVKEDEAGEAWPPSKIPKKNVDEEVAQQSNAKRARVCVRAKCDTPTMNDGCQWRKYGQKIAKGNPCPRAYYRCTVAPACPVRKQVQRCADDMSVLITTYEGTHNHPLPVSATAMASTTSAAASMLLSGSSSSTSLQSLNSHSPNGLNFSLYDHSATKQFSLPNSSSSLFPTITLDLTSPSTSSNSPFNRFYSNSRLVPNSTSTGLSFSSSESSNMLPTIWGTGYQSNNYVAPSCQQPYTEKNHVQSAAASLQALTETLTKAITSDPNFRTVLAAAISSMMGTNSSSSSGPGNQLAAENLKVGEPNQTNSLTQNRKGCGSSYFNGLLSSVSSQIGTSFLQPASLPFSILNNASPSTANNDHKS